MDEEQYPNMDFFKETPLNHDLVSFFVTDTSPIRDANLSVLYNKKIGYYASGSYGPDFFNEKRFVHWKTKTVTQGIKLLFRDRIDAFLGDIQTTETIIKNELPQFADRYVILEPHFLTRIVVPAIAKDHPRKDELKQRIGTINLPKLTTSTA